MGVGACRQGIDSLVLKCIMCSGKGKSRLAGRKGLLGREAVDEVGREAEVNRKGLSHQQAESPQSCFQEWRWTEWSSLRGELPWKLGELR